MVQAFKIIEETYDVETNKFFPLIPGTRFHLERDAFRPSCDGSSLAKESEKLELTPLETKNSKNATEFKNRIEAYSGCTSN
jgi:hypothetical protein